MAIRRGGGGRSHSKNPRKKLPTSMRTKFMGDRVRQFEEMLRITIEGKKPDEKVLMTKNLIAAFKMVVNEGSGIMSKTQVGTARLIFKTLRKKDLTVRELDDILNLRTCTFKVHPDHFPEAE